VGLKGGVLRRSNGSRCNPVNYCHWLAQEKSTNIIKRGDKRKKGTRAHWNPHAADGQRTICAYHGGYRNINGHALESGLWPVRKSKAWRGLKKKQSTVGNQNHEQLIMRTASFMDVAAT
jgi:hypothetical protein